MKHFIGMCALALALCSVPARADSYLSAFGGASVLNDFSGDGAHASFQAEPDTGFVGGVALGTDIDAVPGVKIEFEAAYRRSELQGTLVRCGNEEELGGSSGLFTAMFNVRYGVEVAGFHPYALAGAGYGLYRTNYLHRLFPDVFPEYVAK